MRAGRRCAAQSTVCERKSGPARRLVLQLSAGSYRGARRCTGLSSSPAANPGRIPSTGGDVFLSARPCTAERTAVAQFWADMEVISVHMHMFKC
jgi:hypothetical protein